VSFLPALLGTQGASNAIGVVELIITALLIGRLLDPRLGLLGGLGGVATFLVTLSFMASTPGVFAPEVGPLALSAGLGLFLIKDVVLLAVSAWVVAESARAIAIRAGQDRTPTI
jgi:uncharacterized membrane protein YkgB